MKLSNADLEGLRRLLCRMQDEIRDIAPRIASRARLCDIAVAAMTEIPTAKQRLADQESPLCPWKIR